MASVRARTTKAGVTNYAVLFRHGKRQTSETFVDEESANKFKILVDTFGADRALEMLNEIQPSTGSTPLDDVAQKWLAAKEAERDAGLIVPYTYYELERNYNLRIKPYLGHKGVEFIDENDIQDWVDKLVAEGLAPKTIANRHGDLHQLFSWASSSKRRLAPRNPCTETDLPRRRKKRPKGLTLTELYHLLEVAHDPTSEGYDPDAADVFAFMASTAWRISEAIGLDAGSVEIETDADGETAVYVTMGQVDRRFVGLVQDGKSDASFGRRLRVVGPGVEVLIRRTKGLKPGDLVFTGLFGRKDRPHLQERRKWAQATLRDRRWKTLVKAAGLEHRNPTPHWLRHTHVPICLRAGMTPPEIQRRLGHEHISTTYDMYGDMIDEMMSEETAKRLGDLLSGTDAKVIPLKSARSSKAVAQ